MFIFFLQWILNDYLLDEKDFSVAEGSSRSEIEENVEVDDADCDIWHESSDHEYQEPSVPTMQDSVLKL